MSLQQHRAWETVGLWLGDRKYQFMEQNTQRRLVGLKDKIPDIQKTLETVRFLKARKVNRSSCGSGPAKG